MNFRYISVRKKFTDVYYVLCRIPSSCRQNSYLNFIRDCICLLHWPVEEAVAPNDNECQKLDLVAKAS